MTLLRRTSLLLHDLRETGVLNKYDNVTSCQVYESRIYLRISLELYIEANVSSIKNAVRSEFQDYTCICYDEKESNVVVCDIHV